MHFKVPVNLPFSNGSGPSNQSVLFSDKEFLSEIKKNQLIGQCKELLPSEPDRTLKNDQNASLIPDCDISYGTVRPKSRKSVGKRPCFFCNERYERSVMRDHLTHCTLRLNNCNIVAASNYIHWFPNGIIVHSVEKSILGRIKFISKMSSHVALWLPTGTFLLRTCKQYGNHRSSCEHSFAKR